LSSQVLSDQALSAWVGLLRSHAALTRALNAELVADHGLTLNDYEVLLRLSRAPERQMRRVDLAEQVLLTASGITRLLDGLQASGYVDKAACPSDARVTYAVLTDAGHEKLRTAADVHVAGIHAKFAERYSDGEMAILAELLSRLDGSEPDDESCKPPDSETCKPE
jgi:DNA-binding MarR family transcriptional regulator